MTPIVEFCNCSMFCCALLCANSSFAIILMIELVSSHTMLLLFSGFRHALFFFLVSHDCCVALPHDDTDLLAVCDCGIS